MIERLHPRARLSRTLILVVFSALLSACQRGVLNPAGDVARQQRDIIYISTGLMLLIIVPVMLLIVIFAWRYRKGQGGTYDPEFDHSTSLELVIWSAPLMIIIMLGALTWSSTHLLDPFRPLDRISIDPALAAEPRQEALHVQVVSMDWKWLFIYPDQGIATVNELVLPVNREVRFDITSTNMMNTFYAPTLAGMIYAMPGMQSQLHAVLNRPVEDEGFSANYSGRGFSDMRFKLHGVDAGKFDQWVATAKGSGRALDLPTYLQLLKPSEKVPAMRFAGVDQDLYRRVLERCVEPGKPCASEVMTHEPMAAGAMPAGRESMPTNKPEGALMKSPEEKGTQANRNRFVAPGNDAGKRPTH